jgi:16S rRNA (cytidine1402-2'-O)-methyltransferase
VKRTRDKTSAAKAGSGNGETARRDPKRRVRSSKPEPPQFAQQAKSAIAQASVWTAPHELAPGLHLVATPIGNLGDITLRGLWVLRGVDRILCEDTRVTARLLAHYGVDKPLLAYHDHNAERVRPGILDALRRGERLALVSDAGTPLVSDPGYKLVRAALAEGLAVTAAPGASAALAALTLSGLPPDRFLFAGFPPPRSAARRRLISEWRGLDATLILFEGPSRLATSLADLAAVLGERDAAVGRELTKRHEEVRRGTLSALAAHYDAAGPPRGEVVIVIGPPVAQAAEAVDIDALLRERLGRGSLRDAVAELAAETGLGRQALYRRALALQQGNS